MGDKPKISPVDTYVLDEDELDELDGLSYTRIAEEAALSETGPSSEDDTLEATLDDLSIDEILSGEDSADDSEQSEAASDPDLEDTGTFVPGDVLLAPEEMFSGKDLDDES